MLDLAREAYSILEDSLVEVSDKRLIRKITKLLGEMKVTTSLANILMDVLNRITKEEKELIVPEGGGTTSFLLIILDGLNDKSKLIKDIYGYIHKHLNRTIDLFEELEKEVGKICENCEVRRRVELSRGLWIMWAKTFLKEVDNAMREIDYVVNRIGETLKEERDIQKDGLLKKIFKR